MELTKEDYMAVISEMAYKNIAGTDEADMRRGEREAQEEISGYLRSIYDVAKIFSATGENRNPQIVMFMADVTLYHLSASLPQKMGSEIRKERYDRAIKWLEGVQSGKIVPDIPRTTILDKEGNSTEAGAFIYGSEKKLIHNW